MDGKAIFQKWQYSQMIYVLNAIFNKLPASFLHNGQVDPEIFMEMQGNKKSKKRKEKKKKKGIKTNLKESKVEGLTLSDFNT